MQLKKKEKEAYGLKSKRPSGTKHLPLERIASGVVEDSSAVLFEVSFSRKILKKGYNPPKSEEESLENYYLIKKKKTLLFRKEDAMPGTYRKPNTKISVRCFYHGNKNSLFPYAVYDMNWNLLWKEK
ncbi:MAG: hypothetical protein ABIE36_03760 [Candidatus Diapherotrites archaeon]